MYFHVHSNYILSTAYRPQFSFTRSFICAAKLGPGFLASLTEQVSVHGFTCHCLCQSKMCLKPHLRLLTGCSFQGHGWRHHGVPNFTQRWRRLPLSGACGNVPVVGARCISHPHPSWRQVCVCLKSTGIPNGLWKAGNKRRNFSLNFSLKA